jgi:hypothetical protein
MLTYLLAQRHVVVARLRHRALSSWMLVRMASTACVRRCGMSGRYRRRATSSLCHSQANPLQPLSFVVVVDAAADSVDRRHQMLWHVRRVPLTCHIITMRLSNRLVSVSVRCRRTTNRLSFVRCCPVSGQLFVEQSFVSGCHAADSDVAPGFIVRRG